MTGINAIFFSSLRLWKDKLECLSFASFFQSSLTSGNICRKYYASKTNISDGENKLHNIDIMFLCYKPIYGRKLQTPIISQIL